MLGVGVGLLKGRLGWGAAGVGGWEEVGEEAGGAWSPQWLRVSGSGGSGQVPPGALAVPFPSWEN